jgi:hypothetical protein
MVRGGLVAVLGGREALRNQTNTINGKEMILRLKPEIYMKSVKLLIEKNFA